MGWQSSESVSTPHIDTETANDALVSSIYSNNQPHVCLSLLLHPCVCAVRALPDQHAVCGPGSQHGVASVGSW